MERQDLVKFQGNPLTLVGNETKEGETASDFTAITPELEAASLSKFNDKIKVISVTPSLDTSVCKKQAMRFNEEAQKLSDNVQVLNISMDLPFALARFKSENNLNNLLFLSDHKDADFGEKYGVLIKELRLLSRSIFILDKQNKVHYTEIVPEMTNDPDFNTAMTKLKELL